MDRQREDAPEWDETCERNARASVAACTRRRPARGCGDLIKLTLAREIDKGARSEIRGRIMNGRASSTDLFGFLWVVPRWFPLAPLAPRPPRSRASLPGPATHFIASFRPDDYLALYEGHRRGRRPRSGPAEAPGHPVSVRILDPRRDAKTGLNTGPRGLEMLIESNYEKINSTSEFSAARKKSWRVLDSRGSTRSSLLSSLHPSSIDFFILVAVLYRQ